LPTLGFARVLRGGMSVSIVVVVRCYDCVGVGGGFCGGVCGDVRGCVPQL